MLSIDPTLKALAVSGYSTDPVFAASGQFGFAGALKKPFQLDEFTAVVSRIIERTDAADP